MNKASFRWAFMALSASTLTGCASPMNLFAKKPQSYEEYKAEQLSKQTQIAGSRTAPVSGQVEIAELLNKGHVAFQQGNILEAQSQYFAVVQKQPNHPVANHRLGVIADRQQDYQSAQRYYFAALQASPRDANLLNDVGYSFLLQSRYVEAEQYLQAALRLNGTQSNAINNLGLLYAKQGQADRALAMFRRTNSEAEAQAKLARLMPSGAGATAPPTTMLAQNPWAPQNTMNPPPTWNGGQNGEVAGAPTGPGLPNGYPPNGSNGAWQQPNSAIPNNAAAIAQAGANFSGSAINEPNVSEATRTLREQMEREKRRAVAERQARDLAERQRREMAARQLRDEEFGRSNAVNPNFPPPTDPSRWNLPPNGASNPATNPNGSAQPNGYVDLIPSNVANVPSTLLPNATRGQVPPTGPGSPLDTMPAWPSGDSVPMNSPNNSATGAASWPSVVPSSGTEDPARAAARLGMSGGPGNMFQITPGTTSAPTNSANWPPASNRQNQFAPANGLSPTTPPNWPANANQPPNGPASGEPPAGSFGPGNFNSSANSPSQLPMSPAQYALRDQLPQSEQYQTPNRFGFAPSANNTIAQPTGFTPPPGQGGSSAPQYRSSNLPPQNPAQQPNAMPRNNTRTATSDRFGGTPWEQGQPPGTQSSQTTSPALQGFIPTTIGDNSLLEYERDIQRQNAEINQIRQEIDAQRQLPGSENYSTYGRK